MKTLIVQGKEVFVDDDVYQWAKHFKWQLGERGHVFIHQHRNYVWLHRTIMDTPDDLVCDHIDRNPLNNLRENLRNCTKAQNSTNRLANTKNKLGLRGVSRDKRRTARPYRAYIRANGEHFSIGMYATPEEAAMAYDIKARELHGEFAILNFPEMSGIPQGLLKNLV